MRFLIVFICVAGLARQSSADIVINIDEAAGGITHITASGSVVSAFNGTGGLPGLFFGDSLGGKVFFSTTTDVFDYGIVNGGGTISGETITTTAAYVGSFDIRSTGLVSINPGSVFSINADFVTLQPFSTFIPGAYSGSNIGGIPVNGLITMNITAVPEPSSGLLVLSSAAIGLLRFRRRNLSATRKRLT